MIILSIEHVTNEKEQLQDVSLHIHAGEWHFIGGSKKSGKEYLQAIITGVEKKWSGEVLLVGKSITEDEFIHEKIHFISQNIEEFHEKQTVGEFLSFPLLLKEMSDKDIRTTIESWLKKLSSASLLHKQLHEISLAEKVKLLFIRAFLFNPILIVIDEPFYELTNEQRNIVKKMFKEMREFFCNSTVVLFSSYVRDWLTICDRFTVLNKGKVVQSGTSEELVNDPNDLFIASYVTQEEYSFLRGSINDGIFHSSGISFPLAESVFHNYHRIESGMMTVGLRASDFRYQKEFTSEEIILHLPIQLFQNNNNGCKIYSNIGGQPVVAKVKNHGKMNENATITLAFSQADLYFFDSEQRRIRKERV